MLYVKQLLEYHCRSERRAHMATAQINARIDANTKALGDRALSNIGYSPTKAIRSLWEFAGENINNLKALRELFDEIEQRSNARKSEATEWEKKVAEGPLIIERALREMGIEHYDPPDFSDKKVYEELLEEALYEKYAERGLA